MAAKDILGRKTQTVSKVYSSDSVQIAIADEDDGFLLVQNINYNYQQNVTRLFDLEDAEFQAYVASRPQGQLTMANVVANFDELINFTQKYGDPCQSSENRNIVIEIQGNDEGSEICQTPSGSVSFSFPVLISTAMSIAVADYVVNNQMSFIFASLSSGE